MIVTSFKVDVGYVKQNAKGKKKKNQLFKMIVNWLESSYQGHIKILTWTHEKKRLHFKQQIFNFYGCACFVTFERIFITVTEKII